MSRYGRACCPECGKTVGVTGRLTLNRHGVQLDPCTGSGHPVSFAAVSWPAEAPPLQPCGTHAAFNRHKANGEQPCEACVEGERAYHAARDRRRAAERAAWLGAEPRIRESAADLRLALLEDEDVAA